MNKNEFYTVKEFANTFDITPRTLKFYEEEKIFSPAYINSENGYRYYHFLQFAEFTLILAMKNLGFTIAEMRTFLHDKMTLAEKYEKLIEQKRILDDLIDTFSVYVENNDYKVKQKTIAEHYEYKVLYKAKDIDDIVNAYIEKNKLLPKNKLSVEASRFFYIEYLDSDFRMTDINLSFNYIVKKTTHKDVVLVPQQTVVSVLHLGEYDTLPSAYEFLFDYCSKNNLEICGHPQEFYLSLKSLSLPQGVETTEIGSGLHLKNPFSKSIATFPLTELRFPIKVKD